MFQGILSIEECIYCNKHLNQNSKECGFCMNCGADLTNCECKPWSNESEVESKEEPEEICPECGGMCVNQGGCCACILCGFSLYCNA